MFHLLICCFGGQPFVDFDQRGGGSISSKFHSRQPIDPTDWTAHETSLDLVNLTIVEMSQLIMPTVDPSFCSLFNLTFTTITEEEIFEHYKARIECSCLTGYDCSPSCDCLPTPFPSLLPVLPSPEPLSAIEASPVTSINTALASPMLIIAAAVLLALFVLVFLMTKGCFCDCFGPFKWPCSDGDMYDKPMDPEDARKCLERVRAVERERETGESSQPLVSTINSSCPMSYPSAPPQIDHRSYSPPPPYSSIVEEGHSTYPPGRQVTQI